VTSSVSGIVIDASDVVLGRLASQVAMLLRGKHKPIFAPHVDTVTSSSW
jgi:large subunit ribosomal protein L13